MEEMILCSVEDERQSTCLGGRDYVVPCLALRHLRRNVQATSCAPASSSSIVTRRPTHTPRIHHTFFPIYILSHTTTTITTTMAEKPTAEKVHQNTPPLTCILLTAAASGEPNDSARARLRRRQRCARLFYPRHCHCALSPFKVA